MNCSKLEQENLIKNSAVLDLDRLQQVHHWTVLTPIYVAQGGAHTTAPTRGERGPIDLDNTQPKSKVSSCVRH